jgi:zinc transport system substrate-binding protein
MKQLAYIVIISGLFSSCTNPKSPSIGVVATTAWTAAYALAAGATDVSVLAPYEMVHPSEYELRPGDIERLSRANLIIYAGYEVMVDQIRNGLNIPVERLTKISTSYNALEIEKSIMLIAKQLGTEQIAAVNIAEIKQLMAEGKLLVQEKGLDKGPVLVHFFQESFALEVGIEPVMIFGPAPPEPKQILALTKTKAVLILDNAHNPVGGPVKEILENCDYKLLMNFPGMHQTRTLADVIRYNIGQLNGK